MLGGPCNSFKRGIELNIVMGLSAGKPTNRALEPRVSAVSLDKPFA